jgi:hypothetical protein
MKKAKAGSSAEGTSPDPAPPPSADTFHEETGETDKPIPTAAQIAAAAQDIMIKQSAAGSASARVGAAFNWWEKECGVDREMVREAIKHLNGNMTPSQFAKFQAEKTRYLIAVGLLPVADAAWAMAVKQADLGIEAVAAGGDVGENLRFTRAKAQGERAGLKNRPLIANPWQASPGSPEFVGWRDGHGEGQALRKELHPDKANVTQADDSRERVEPDDPIGATAGSA